MQTTGVVDPVELALLRRLLVLALLFPEDPSSASVHGMKLLDASLFFARLTMAELRHALQHPYEYWSTSGETNPRLSMVVDPVSCV